MNETFWTIYAISVVGNVSILCGLFGVLALTAAVMILIWALAEPSPVVKKWLYRTSIAGICLVLASAFIPDQKTLVAMIGGAALQEVVTSEDAKKTGGKALDALNRWLDEASAKEKK